MTRRYTRGTLEERFWAYVDKRGPDDCWLWTAGASRSGRREVYYGTIAEGPIGGRTWRANRLALLLKTAPVDSPRDHVESFIDWIRRANRWREDYEAAHTCDVSLCCNPAHLEWQSHGENVSAQRRRRETKRALTVARYAAVAVLVLAALLTVAATPARADELDPHPRIFGALMAGAVSLQIVDLRQTKACLSAGTCHESNPTMAPVAGQLALLGVVKGSVVGAVNATAWSMRRRHPRIAFALVAAEFAVQSAVVVRNYRELSTVRR